MFDMFWIRLCDAVYSYFFSFNSYNITVKSEAVVRRCSVKKVFLKFSQNLQEKTCARVSFIIKLPARTTQGAASVKYL